MTFFDVGQGDSALIQFPFGKTMLIDAGGGRGDWNLGARVLIPELTRLGILTLDKAQVSHPDQDHAYGFVGLVNRLKIEEIIAPKRTEDVPLMQQLLASTRKSRATLLESAARFRWRDVEVTTYVPKLSTQKNDLSLVTKLNFGRCSVLFTGDIEKGAEREIISLLQPERISVLKIAHHGSKTSSTAEFLRHFKPRLGVISVGRHNLYRHPAPQVVNRLKDFHLQILRTDFHGHIKLTISKKGEVSCEDRFGSCGNFKCPY